MITSESFHHYSDSQLNQRDAEQGFNRVEGLNTLTTELLADDALTRTTVEKALVILIDLESIEAIAPTVRRVVKRHAPWLLTDEA